MNGTPLRGRKDRRVAIIQELPVETMLFPNMSYLDNICFTLDHRMRGVWGRGHIKKSLRRELAGLLGEDVFDTPIERLGEWQKYDLIYTRIYLQAPDIVFCVQPFKSAEVSLRVHIMELLECFLNRGIPVVILAVNLADSLALADRLLRVGRDGRGMSTTGRNLPRFRSTRPGCTCTRREGQGLMKPEIQTIYIVKETIGLSVKKGNAI